MPCLRGRRRGKGKSSLLAISFFVTAEGGVQGGQWRQVVRRGDIVLKFADKEYPTVKDIADSLRGNRAGEYQYAVFYAASVKVPVEVPRLQLN